ncbi:phospholipase [Nonomuraea sp. NPDC049714]|uniref:phospholipase n=1 Tax=Nonomuraea sp. NPDC049714 TaxID=3364357 RepID=UPI00378F1F15
MALAGALASSVSAPAAASPAATQSLETQAEPTKAQRLARLARLTAVGNAGAQLWVSELTDAHQGRNYWRWNWTTDYCSSSPDKPGGFNFELACWRHDFGYRNYKSLRSFSSPNKERVDKAFLYDMERVCNRAYGFLEVQRATCRRIAKQYYNAVRLAGIL